MSVLTVDAAVVIRAPGRITLLERDDIFIVCEYVLPPVLSSQCGLRIPYRHIQCDLTNGYPPLRTDTIIIEVRVPSESLKEVNVFDLQSLVEDKLREGLLEFNRRFVVVVVEGFTVVPTIDLHDPVPTLCMDVDDGILKARHWQQFARLMYNQQN